MTSPSWYIMLTEPQREQTAVAGLVARRVKAYCPVEYKKLIRRGRKLTVERPLFPGYVFVRLTEDVDDFSLPRRVAGIRNYMRDHATKPCVMPDGMLAAIEQREQVEYERFHRSPSGFSLGEGVRVADGPFMSFAAEVFRLDPSGRVEALVDIFGRKTRVEFDAHQLEKV